MSKYKILWANEFIPAARETYRANMSEGCLLDDRDIRTVQPEEILEAIGLKAGDLDLFDGSPPCASFSTAGKREAGWGKVKKYSDTQQRTDDLFFEYIRLLKGLRPRVFIAENVAGLVKGTAKGYFKIILKELKQAGYRVEARLLDAQWLGVPQSRQRLIFQGVREDLGLEPAFPKPFLYRHSIKEAIPWVRSVVHDTSGLFSTGDVTHRPSPCITVGPNAMNSRHFKVEPETDISRYAIGREWDRIKVGQQSNKYFNLVKPDLDQPCPTITQTAGITGAAGVVHPTEKRKFTIAELKRICSFPDDFILTGSYAQQWERLGRSVPPLMMKAIAESVFDGVLQKVGG
jgi:DNA (cytosine-5)-methyltransferase 1